MMGGPRAYVTYFDQRYLALAVVMLRSIRRSDPGALVFALCFDSPSVAAIRRLSDPSIVTLSHDDMLAFEPRLADCRNRPRGAFYATHKPVLPLLALSRRPDLSAIVHVDADCCFSSSPAPLFDEIGGASIALSPHDFSPVFADLVACGRFNAGFIYWRHDDTGVRCLEAYREDCLAWCEPRVEPDGRFMNQGYLTRWPERYAGVHVIRHPGVNLAYWNLARRSLSGVWRVMVNGDPLVCYHFSGLFRDEHGTWRNARRDFGANLTFAIERIYEPFLARVEETDAWLRAADPTIAPLETGWLNEGEPVGQARSLRIYRA
jgi:hypothetical protein